MACEVSAVTKDEVEKTLKGLMPEKPHVTAESRGIFVSVEAAVGRLW